MTEKKDTPAPSIIWDYNPVDKVATVSLNRPSKMNALSFDMFAEFEKVFETVTNPTERDVRAIVLTSTSKHFTAGLDLTAAASIGQSSALSDDVARAALSLQRLVGPL